MRRADWLTDPVFGLAQPDAFCDAQPGKPWLMSWPRFPLGTYISPVLDRARAARIPLSWPICSRTTMGWARFKTPPAPSQPVEFLHDAAPPAFPRPSTTIDYQRLVEENRLGRQWLAGYSEPDLRTLQQTAIARLSLTPRLRQLMEHGCDRRSGAH